MAILDYLELALLGLDGLVVYGFYKAYKHFSKDADVIEGLPLYTVGQELYSYVDKLPNKCLPYVGIYGLSKMSEDARTLASYFKNVDLIHKSVKFERKAIPTFLFWDTVTNKISDVVQSCKFGICAPDAFTSRNDPSLFVEVRHPLKAEYLVDNLPIIKDYFKSSGVFKGIFSISKEEYIRGHQYEEFALPEGVPVFGVGKIFISSDKPQLCFGPPDLINNKYILTTLTKPEVIDSLRGPAKFYKHMFYTSLLIGTGVAIWLLYKFLSRDSHAIDGGNQIEDFQMDDVACNICLASLRNIFLLPCRHLAVCSGCYNNLPSPKKCPTCMTLVKKCVPIYVT